MASPEEIKNAMERTRTVFTARPDKAQMAKVSVTTWQDGLRCLTKEDGFEISTDMPGPIGGENTAPSPGALVRAALGSCSVIGYAMLFAKNGIPFSALSVRVEGELNMRGPDGIDGTPAGLANVRCIIELESPAEEAEINRILDKWETVSPVLAIYSESIKVNRELKLNAVQGAAE